MSLYREYRIACRKAGRPIAYSTETEWLAAIAMARATEEAREAAAAAAPKRVAVDKGTLVKRPHAQPDVSLAHAPTGGDKKRAQKESQ